jgi:hypothetical protein
MSDEYSLHGRFLMGKDSAAEYERRLARLRKAERTSDDERAQRMPCENRGGHAEPGWATGERQA